MVSDWSASSLSSGASTATSIALNGLIQKIRYQMNSGVTTEQMFNFIFESLGLMIPFDRIGVAVLVGQGADRKLVSKWVKSRVPIQHLRTSYFASIANSSLRQVVDSGRPRIIDDLERYANDHPFSESTKLILQDGMRSSLTCPLRAENRPVGVVFFSSATAFTYSEEHVQMFLEVAEEISLIVEQSRLQEISRSLASRDQSFRMALHDLKSPLSVIQGFLEVANDKSWFDDLTVEARQIFLALDRNAKYMAELVKELSELANLNQNAVLLDSRHILLKGLIEELIVNGQVLSRGKEISFRAEVEPGLPNTIACDLTRVKRAVDNLFTNAVKYSLRKSVIVFSVGSDKENLLLSVSDTGLGIPEDEIPKLFTEFGKTSVRPTEGEPSSGLGLAIVKKIVTQHGGSVSVKSKVAEGSVFTISLPFR